MKEARERTETEEAHSSLHPAPTAVGIDGGRYHSAQKGPVRLEGLVKKRGDKLGVTNRRPELA